jgi:hypothetical protein
LKSENGKHCKDRRERQIMEAVEGIAKKECLEKDKLTMTSPPEEWIKALFSGTQMPTQSTLLVLLSHPKK